jgi:hypothetical protein
MTAFQEANKRQSYIVKTKYKPSFFFASLSLSLSLTPLMLLSLEPMRMDNVPDGSFI